MGIYQGERESYFSICLHQSPVYSTLNTDTMGYADAHFKEKSAQTVAHSEPVVYIILKLLTWLEFHDYHFNPERPDQCSALYIMPVMTWSYNNLGT